MEKALVDPSLSQQAALFHQRTKLQENISANGIQGRVWKSVTDTLTETSHVRIVYRLMLTTFSNFNHALLTLHQISKSFHMLKLHNNQRLFLNGSE